MSGVNRSFWRSRKVFLTGHTGFKGGWLALWLKEMGAHVHGYSLNPPTNPSLFDMARIGTVVATDTRADIRDLRALQGALHAVQPEVVFHLAAQPLVRRSYEAPLETFEVNVMGTANILRAMNDIESVRAAVIVTSDKCYENRSGGKPCRETDSLGGQDPYSASKACAEIVVSSFRSSAAAIGSKKSSIAIASVRSGNVVGGGDWSEDRLLPDCIRAFARDQPVRLRSSGAVRPWLHVLEPLKGYITLAERLFESGSDQYATAFNFGPHDENEMNVLQIAKNVAQLWGAGAKIEIDRGPNPPEAMILRLDTTKASEVLGWKPHWTIPQTLERTVDWYRAWSMGRDMQAITVQQLADCMTVG